MSLPSLTAPKFSLDGSSRDIDRRVKALLSDALAVYHVDADRLSELSPDVIVTQSQCAVCAVSLLDVERAVCQLISSRPRIVSLEPNNLAGVWIDIHNIAVALGTEAQGATLVTQLQERVEAIAARTHNVPRPTVACIEWVDPLMAAGNWMPELVALAGGTNLFGHPGQHSSWMTREELFSGDPAIIVVLPCGFDLQRTRLEMHNLASDPRWSTLQAVRNRRVYVTDGNQYFNRPGPRLADSLEILAEIIHPELFPDARYLKMAWQCYP